MEARSFLVILMANSVILVVKLVSSPSIVPFLSLVSINFFSYFIFHYPCSNFANLSIECWNLLDWGSLSNLSLDMNFSGVRFMIMSGYRTVVEAGTVVWNMCESSLSSAFRGSGCFGIDNLRWGPSESHRRIRSSSLAAVFFEDQSVPFTA